MKEKFALWYLLFLEYIKRDWKKILFWVVGLAAFSGGFAPYFDDIAQGSGLVGMYETMQNPAMMAMVGPTPITNSGDYTIGAMYANEMLLFCGLFAMIISVLHVVGHTRKEEDLGLQELIRSFRVGRQANSLAVILENTLINVLVGVGTAALLISFDMSSIDVTGSLLFAASIALAGILGGVLGLLVAQIMATSAGATGGALSIVGVLYLLRAVTDVSHVQWSMVNPMGWTYLTYPFTENRWYPIVFGVIFALVVTLIAFLLEGNRDLSDGYLPEWEGRGKAPRSLLSVPGLLFRNNRGVALGWLIGYGVMGLAYGSIYGDMQTFMEGNDLMKQMFTHSGISLEASFTATIMMVMIGLAVILPVVVINKLYAAETRLYLSQIFATKVSRGQLYWWNMILAFLFALLAILISAGGLGGSALAVMSTKTTLTMASFMEAGLNYLPVILFFMGLAGLVLGFAPGLGKLIYAYLGYSFAISYFGGILDLPTWVNKTSALNWPARMPMEDFDWVPFALTLAVSLVMIIMGAIGYRNRDLKEGA
ncbi:ABC transporter permease [Enterococcus diestrammenae]|uniref:ABC transporter permease n=1 Tax=Enterococcus diestrammenae TaxID=1155073 RepID=UPI00195BEDC4